MTDLTGLRRHDGYLPIEDHGLIGDGSGCALVGRDGAIRWMCVPRFADPPLFCGVLDAERGGEFTLAPERTQQSRQHYIVGTGVLVTELQSPTGLVEITDGFLLHGGARLEDDAAGGRGEVLRHVRVLAGTVTLRLVVRPHGGAVVRRRLQPRLPPATPTTAARARLTAPGQPAHQAGPARR